jgi:hypothetical protein
LGIKFSINSKAFSEYTKESCYWAGFLAADGNISKGHNSKYPYCRVRVYLADYEVEHLFKLKVFLNAVHKISVNEKYHRCSLEFSDAEIAKDLLQKFGIHPKKSLTYRGPSSEMPEEMMKYFIRGYFDGDGGVHEYLTHRSCKYKSLGSQIIGTSEFIGLIKPICYAAIGKTNEVKNWVTSNNITTVMSFSTNDSMKLLSWLYEDSTENCRLNRKFDKYHKIVVQGERELNIDTRDNGIVHAM